MLEIPRPFRCFVSTVYVTGLLGACSSSRDAPNPSTGTTPGPDGVFPATLTLTPPVSGFQLETVGTVIEPGQDSHWATTR